ncbi:MAG: hypothetical protein UR15_C0030G0005 [Parcubacteria group bacterium GW2011_GWA2_31_28]|nr:MAG: hypothetical protein UR15_C0030G0005 [Parcubacteria group bacterium GW2011_GWA2_31_28]
MGCPGALNGSSHVISKALENGDTALQFFQDNGQSHISGRDFAKRLNLDYAIFWPKNKISLNLVIFFKNISTSSEDSQPGTGLSINNLYLIAGKRSRSKPKTGNDGIVPLEDIYSINSSVSYNNGEVMIYNVYHDNLPDDESIQNYVKDKLIGRVS